MIIMRLKVLKKETLLNFHFIKKRKNQRKLVSNT